MADTAPSTIEVSAPRLTVGAGSALDLGSPSTIAAAVPVLTVSKASLPLGPSALQVRVPTITATRANVPPTVGPQALVVIAQGPAGPPGAPGGAVYTFTQATPAAQWTISHNLGRRPPIVLRLVSDPQEPVYTDVTYVDENTALVTWPSPESGWADL